MKKIKILGIISTIGGFAISLLSDYVESKQTEAMIDEKIEERINARFKNVKSGGV